MNTVKKMENFTEKSFKNYTGPDREFKQKNIIFGYNGRGKSSLAKGIIKEFLINNPVGSDSYRFFDRNYINNNLLLKESTNSKIKGVIANFGKKDVDVEKQIDLLESEIIDTTTIEKEINELNNKIRTEIDKIHDTKKGKIAIQKKSISKTNDEVIALYNEDLEKAKKIESDENKLLIIKGDDSLEIQKSKIETVIIPPLNIILNENINEIKEIFNKTFDDIEIPTSKIVEWITNGLSIHKKGDKCKFCGGTPNLDLIQDNVNKYNSNEKQKAAIKLTNFKNEIDTLNLQINRILDFKNNIIANFGNETTKYFDNIESNVNLLAGFKEKINNKIENINSRINFEDEKLKNILSSIKKSYDSINQVKVDELKILDEKISKLNILIKGAICLEINNNTFIKNNMQMISQKQKFLNEARIKNQANLDKIKALKDSKSNTKDFADHISEILSMLEVNLKLEVLNDDYIIKQSITNDKLQLDDISEGEQNLLSLLYFYYELFEDKEQKNLKSSIDLIVIDDPISSVDDINKMYVLELIKKICELEGIQLFIFTHVWEDFCNICYNKADTQKTPYGIYEIKKDANGSKIVCAKTNETPYKHDFKDIYEFSQKQDCSDMTDCEIYHYPNIMRKILEEFLSFKVKNNNPTYTNFNNIKKVLCNDKPTSKDEMAIGMLLNVCNILSHKATRNPDEILKSAKFLMNKIENVDKLHFDTMKE